MGATALEGTEICNRQLKSKVTTNTKYFDVVDSPAVFGSFILIWYLVCILTDRTRNIELLLIVFLWLADTQYPLTINIAQAI